MREIKFRAWSTVDKKMYYDAWFDNLEVHWFSEEEDEWVCIGDREANSMLHQIFLMQFTGLLDRQGKEIWEGDIVKTCRRIGRGYRENDIEAVHYSEITARWYPIDVVVTERCEVIGNIYENPELLKD